MSYGELVSLLVRKELSNFTREIESRTVPARYERNYEFTKKFGINIKPVIEQITGEKRIKRKL